MGNRYRKIKGWESFAGEWFLRMSLTEPRLTAVWPGTPSIEKPAGELRHISDEVLTYAQAMAILTAFPSGQYGVTEMDVQLLSQALSQYPPHVRNKRVPLPLTPIQ